MKPEQYENKMQEASLQGQQLRNLGIASQIGNQHQEQESPGMIKEQLSLGEELVIIDNLLRSQVLKYYDNGSSEWVTPEDEDQIILSDKGVHFFRRIISAYINKNTLLSNYNEETILDKMKDIATVINDRLFLSYEVLFKMPSIERCVKELENEVKDKIEIRKAFYKIVDKEYEDEQMKREVEEQLIVDFEKKLEKVKEKLFAQKLNDFEFTLRWIQDFIHSAYNRALGGQERRSLRQHMSITETSGGFNIPQNSQKKGLFSKIGGRYS